MDSRFSAYNTHQLGLEKFWELDNHLRTLKQQPYIYHNPILQQLPWTIPGIYTIGGGRQIGKTTLLKQWMAWLLEQNVPAESIAFYTGELIDDFHGLIELIQNFTSTQPLSRLNYILIDEITYIQQWDRGIKFVADAGYLQNSVVVITGSDLSMMQATRMTFPGRRGKADLE